MHSCFLALGVAGGPRVVAGKSAIGAAQPGRWRLQNIFGALTVLFVGAFALSERELIYDPEVTGVENIFSAGQLLQAPDSRRGRMLVWGWAPELYVLSGWTPATRDILTYNEIWPKPNRGLFPATS